MLHIHRYSNTLSNEKNCVFVLCVMTLAAWWGLTTSKTHSLVSIKSCSPAAGLWLTWTWHSGNLLSSTHHDRDGSNLPRGRVTESTLITTAICRSYCLFTWLSDPVQGRYLDPPSALVSPDPFGVTFHSYYHIPQAAERRDMPMTVLCIMFIALIKSEGSCAAQEITTQMSTCDAFDTP